MMEGMEGIESNNFIFYNNFDSANLDRVQCVIPDESTALNTAPSSKNTQENPDVEFNIWTRRDCQGTEFENGNRSWFHFGIRAPTGGQWVRLNIVDMNRQGKMFSQGMAPVYRVLPGKPNWDRIRDKPVHKTEGDVFIMSFKFRTPENPESIIYFAFTYPFSYTDNQKMLERFDKFSQIIPNHEDDIYYKKEILCYSLEGREINLLTISSFYNIKEEQESRLNNLFPCKCDERPFKFDKKKIIFMSARVHPGETPASFVFNGFLNLLLTRDDPIAIMLRKLYVFKMIPMLNPDGVALGYYRTDTRGVNLNRVYLNPNFSLHPSIYAARALIRYYHFGCEKEDVITDDGKVDEGIQKDNISNKVSSMSLEDFSVCDSCRLNRGLNANSSTEAKYCEICGRTIDNKESGLFLYMDMHGHASKKGIFIYGNHFQDLKRNVDCMILPKIMSLNSHHFHFTACNFTEKNMYLKDKRDGMSREGSGRVAVLKLTGLTKSYTLECNYNTGRIVNTLPPSIKESHPKTMNLPPKYTPQVFEEVGKSLGASILDLTGHNPHSRIPHSEFHNLSGIREWLSTNCCNEWPINIRVGKGKDKSTKNRQSTIKLLTKTLIKRPSTLPIDKKENQPSCSKSSERLTRNKPQMRLTKSLELRKIKPKNSKEKSKNVIVKKIKSRLDLSTTTTTTTTTTTAITKQDQERIKLREICLLKGSNEKKTILKYKPSQSVIKKVFKDDLLVTWEVSPSVPIIKNNDCNMKSKVTFNQSTPSLPGPSKEGNVIMANYSKKSFIKSKKKHHLRRLTSSAADHSGKIDKISNKNLNTNNNNINIKKKKLKNV